MGKRSSIAPILPIGGVPIPSSLLTYASTMAPCTSSRSSITFLLCKRLKTLPTPRPAIQILMARGGGPAFGGAPPRLADLGNFSEPGSLVIGAGGPPDSQKFFFYVEDRAQTWLDICVMQKGGGTPTRLFRETTKAWV